MKKLTWKDGVIFLLWLLPLIYLAMVYSTLPQIVPLHFGMDGKPDSYGSRSKFILVVLLMMVVAAIAYLLLKYLPRIDPKRKVRYSQSTFQQMSFVLLLFITVMNMSIIYAVTHEGFQMNKLLFPLCGLLFTYLGNIMHSIKPNYFVGIRTPWTLENEDNWRKTHQLGGKIWLTGGLLITLITLLLPAKGSLIFFAIALSIMALIPVIYSYLYFKKHQTKL
jgi:uncharacterized membrane protein